jgi:hypothetical protein
MASERGGAPIARGSARADHRGAGAAQHRAVCRSRRGVDSAARPRRRPRLVSFRPFDRKAVYISESSAAGGSACGAGKHRGAGNRSALARDRLRLHGVSWASRASQSPRDAHPAVSRKAVARRGRALSARRPVLLEQRHVFLEGQHFPRGISGAPSKNGRSTGTNRAAGRLRRPGRSLASGSRVEEALSHLREYFCRLRGHREIEPRARHPLRIWLERCGKLECRARPLGPRRERKCPEDRSLVDRFLRAIGRRPGKAKTRC